MQSELGFYWQSVSLGVLGYLGKKLSDIAADIF